MQAAIKKVAACAVFTWTAADFLYKNGLVGA
jgi:hypothetical protein